MSYGDIGRGVENLVKYMAVIIVVSVPFALWKLIEIVIWANAHIHLVVKP